MRIAIVGAGLAGLAAAWHLSKIFSVTVFDANGIGSGASGIAAGLMHPFSGANANLNPNGFEGMAATLRLIHQVEKATGKTLTKMPGLLRPAITPFQKKSYASSQSHYSKEIEWWSNEKCRREIPHLANEPGIFIPSALKIECPEYLQALWSACEAQGAHLEKAGVAALEELNDFDAILVAAGASSARFPELSRYQITPVKGQLLELTNLNSAPLPFSLSSNAYIVSHSLRSSFYAGSTYEREFSSPLPDLNSAKKLILPKLAMMLPSLANAEILDCQSGVRASTADHLPIAERVDDKIWVLTGFGSKGLLYHALYAENLTKKIAEELLRRS